MSHSCLDKQGLRATALPLLAPGGCSPKLARSATQREAPGNNKLHQDLHQSLFSLVACRKTTRLPLHVFLCKVQGSLQPFPDWEGPSCFGNPDRDICTQYLLPSAQQPALASRRMSASGAKGGTAARSWGSIAELLTWVHVQHFKGAAAAATQILCLLAKQCQLRVICPVTTSLDASPSQTIKQEACFPRFVITRSRCSCLSLSFQAARAACKHFISNLLHPTLSSPAFPAGGINPLTCSKQQHLGHPMAFLVTPCQHHSAPWGLSRQLSPHILVVPCSPLWHHEHRWQCLPWTVAVAV